MDKLLLSPGTLVTGKTDEKVLYLWNSYESSDDESAIPVDNNDLLIIVAARANENKLSLFTPEWMNGAYLVLSSRGQKGWLGEGWVTPVI